MVQSAEAVKFIQTVADDIGLPHELIEVIRSYIFTVLAIYNNVEHCSQVTPGNKIVLITVEGTHPEMKSVLLNSHYDVVPVFPVGGLYNLVQCPFNKFFGNTHCVTALYIGLLEV